MTRRKKDPSKKSFWDQPAIRRKVPGKAYTRFVRSMRLLLPLVAVAMIAVVVAWPRMEETVSIMPKTSMLPKSVAKNELVNPRFASEDEKSQPFTLTAERAVQNAQNPDLVLLEKPTADMVLRDETWLAARADQGVYRQESENLLLEGDVKLFHDEGYEVQTSKLLLNLKTNKAWSDQAVSGQGPAGTLEASGMRVNAEEETLLFTGPVKLVLNRAVKGLP